MECSNDNTSNFVSMPHTSCLIGSQSIDCTNGNLYYVDGKQCAICGDSSTCLGVPATGQSVIGICMQTNP